MAEEAIRYRISADGAETTARAFDKVAGSQKAANDQFKTLSINAARSAQTMSALGATLTRISPELGGFGTAVGRASSAIMGMTTVIGGPAGLIAGGLVAGLGLLVESLRNTKTAEEELAESTARTTALLDKQRAAAELTAAAIAGRIEGNRRMTDARLRGLRESGFFDSVTSPSGAFGEEEYKKRNAAELSRINELENASGFEDAKAKKTGDPLFEAMQRRDATNRQLAALNKMDTGRSAFGGDGGRSALEAKEAENVAFLDRHRQFREDLLEEDRRYHESNAALEAEAHKRREQYQAVAIDAAQSFERVSISGMQKIAKGQKFTVKELLSGIGDEMVAGGTKWIMEGTGRLIASYGTDPSGWGLIGLGGAEVAFGLGLGAMTRAGGGGGAAGGRQQRPMSPIGSGGGGGLSEPQTIIINMPTVVSPGPQDGVRVQQALDEARRAGLGRAA